MDNRIQMALAALAVAIFLLYRMMMAARAAQDARDKEDAAKRAEVLSLFKFTCSGCKGKFPEAGVRFMGVQPDNPRKEIRLCAKCMKRAGIGGK